MQSRRLPALVLTAALAASGCSARFDPSSARAYDATGLPIVESTYDMSTPSGAASVSSISPTSGPLRRTPGSTSMSTPGAAAAFTAGSARRGPSPAAAPSSPRSGSPSPASVPAGSRRGVTATSIKIAWLIPKTGAAPVPPQLDQAIQAYWRFVNETKGGILGRQITSTVFDTTSNEQVAREKAQQVIDDGYFAAITLERIGVTKAIIDYLEQRDFPVIALNQPPGIDPRSQWNFSINLDQQVQGGLIARYLAHALHQTNVAAVYENEVGVIPAIDEFARHARGAGAAVVARVAIDPNASDFSGVVRQLQSAGAAAVWLYMTPTVVIKLVNQAQAVGYHPTWMSSSVAWTFDLTIQGTPTGGLAGAHGFAPWPPMSDVRTQTYRETYQRFYADPAIDIGLAAWGSQQVVAAALLAAGRDLGQNRFRAAFQALRVSGVGPVDGTPLLWPSISFGPGVRNGARDVITLREERSTWVLESNYRSDY